MSKAMTEETLPVEQVDVADQLDRAADWLSRSTIGGNPMIRDTIQALRNGRDALRHSSPPASKPASDDGRGELVAELERLAAKATALNGEISQRHRVGCDRFDVHGHPCGLPIASFMEAEDAALFIALRNNLPAILSALSTPANAEVVEDVPHIARAALSRIASTPDEATSRVLTYDQMVPADEAWKEAVEQVISAWAFAHNIDGSARNDLFARLRARAVAAIPRPDGGGDERDRQLCSIINELVVGIMENGGDALIALKEAAERAQAAILTPPDDRIRVAIEAANDLVERASDTYRKRNGHIGSVEADDGEKCWIVHSDDLEGLRAALTRLQGTP